MVLTGVHPFARWMDLPGPRGWLPAVMFVFALICFPIWVSFHASVLGDLLAGLTRTKELFNGASIHMWGGLSLVAIFVLAMNGGYVALEKAQVIIVTMMLLAVTVALFLLWPDWSAMAWGAFVPQRLEYPNWVLQSSNPAIMKIAARPVWVEAGLYLGAIGGASYDYLAYTSFLREKRWGMARSLSETPPVERSVPDESAKNWIRAPLIDCTLSFLLVIVFSFVFVASGAVVLGPQQQVPSEGRFLEHQAQFVTSLHAWLYPLYVMGACLTMLGTLYGTLEVGPAIFREAFALLKQTRLAGVDAKLRKAALLWSVLGAMAVLIVCFVYQWSSDTHPLESKPPGLTELLVPASLFTGVLSCGLICLLNPWIDRRLPRRYQTSTFLHGLNLIAGVVFLVFGVKGYWDFGGWWAFLILLATIAVGFFLAALFRGQWRS